MTPLSGAGARRRPFLFFFIFFSFASMVVSESRMSSSSSKGDVVFNKSKACAWRWSVGFSGSVKRFHQMSAIVAAVGVCRYVGNERDAL